MLAVVDKPSAPEDVFKSASFPGGLTAFEAMRVVRNLGPRLPNRAIFFDALMQQNRLVREHPELATGFELNNFHCLLSPRPLLGTSPELREAALRIARSLGYEDPVGFYSDFISRQDEILREQGEEVYQERALKFGAFLADVYKKLREEGYLLPTT